MANRRIEVHEVRHVIVRMRAGDSDRQIQNAGVMGRRKIAQIRKIAKECGWLDKNAPMPDNDTIAAKAPRPIASVQQSQVEPYAEQVIAWAERGITATAIHAALVRRYGFTGAYNSVKRFLRRQRKAPVPTIILDFKPGEVGQVDFGSGPQLVDWATGEVRKTWFFVMTLAYSRHQYLEFVLDQKVETWLGCHRRAFEFFGGVPRKVLIDNPKCAITKACYHDPEVQRSYADCAEGYGFLISPCPVRDPKKKGIVESGVKYVKRNFLPLREFLDLADLNRQALAWVMETAGNRVHGTTGERPLTHFAEVEKTFLRELPEAAPELVVWGKARVHGDCHVQFEKCRYSVPFRLVRKELWVRTGEDTVQLYEDQTLVAVHPRLRRKGLKSTKQDHLPPEAQAYLMADPQWCLEQAEKAGEHCRELLETMFSHRVLDRLRAAQGVIRLGVKYGKVRLEAACARALLHGSPRYRTVKGILEKGLDQQRLPEPEPLSPVYRGKGRFASTNQNPLQ